MPQRSKGPRLWLKPGRNVWYIKDGSARHSTGCGARDIRDAEQALARYLAAKHAREAASRRGGHVDETPIAEVLMAYWMAKKDSVARPSLLKAQLGRLSAWWGDKTVGEIDKPSCAAFIAERGAATAAARELAYLKAAIHHAAKERIITSTVPVHVPRSGAVRHRWLTRDEMARLLWAAWRLPRGKHVARFILMARYTGSRSGAICAASLRQEKGRGWVDLENGVYYRAGAGEAETNKRKPTIRLPAPLLAHMRRWPKARYVVEYRGGPVKSVKKGFAQARLDAGLGPDVTPHVLRHTAITWACQSGADMWEACGFFGVTREVMEQVYAHQHPDHQGSVHRSLTGKPSPNPSRAKVALVSSR